MKVHRLLIHSPVGEDGADSGDLQLASGGAVKPYCSKPLLLCCAIVGLAHRDTLSSSAPALEGVLLDSACSAVSLPSLAARDRLADGLSRASKPAMWKGGGECSRSASSDIAGCAFHYCMPSSYRSHCKLRCRTRGDVLPFSTW